MSDPIEKFKEYVIENSKLSMQKEVFTCSNQNCGMKFSQIPPGVVTYGVYDPCKDDYNMKRIAFECPHPACVMDMANKGENPAAVKSNLFVRVRAPNSDPRWD